MSAQLQWFVEQWQSWIGAISWQIVIWIALISVVAWLARGASPRLRYLLWLLVLVKVFLPPSLALPWGVGTWGIDPVWKQLQERNLLLSNQEAVAPLATADDANQRANDSLQTSIVQSVSPLFLIWLAGCCGFWFMAVWQYTRLLRSTRDMELLEEGPLRIELERLALQLGEKRVPELYLSKTAASPYLFGILQPRIVIPQQLIDSVSASDQRSVLAHELVHWGRCDLWIGFLQAIAQGLLWFHPFMWWANARLRQERECACDECVLRTTDCDPSTYGETLLRVLSAVRGKALFQGNLVGVFEPGANIQQRMEEIMNYRPENSRVKLWWYAALAGLSLVFLPMASITSAINVPAQPAELPAWVEASSPSIGATGVDPQTAEIRITFDRDMEGGMSWTGDQPLFPEAPQGAKAQWRDKRTCVLPVKLKAGEYYRVGINSTSFQNFRSVAGEPAPCTAIYFTTKGASKSVESRVRVPHIAEMVPENGATDVDPDTKVLRVTFNVSMGKGMSWTGGGASFPESPEGQTAKWSADGKTCLLPVSLKPNHEYQLGINSRSHINFQSKWGVPVAPVVYSFETIGE
ncbi:M56 family metallopeptidase [Bythopirellula polymerisocia]|uniref:Regulatory protein BlaR1 n=1 Tax=Bythopirellula polymerisocia TaxID=2528003 RepID=A0A5C6D0B9_9BACT|nr:M56 family metallopeptidase [Bythopirellula polymerisocia]TWU30310.1 Regulatory protein BlaR1 [Bythopirellula polymerisocia]